MNNGLLKNEQTRPETTTEITKKTTNDRRARTHTDNNDHVSHQSLVVFDFSILNWPQGLNKSQPNQMALAKLPNDEARQQVLDVIAESLKKDAVRKPTSFLRKLVQNYLVGDFTPVEKIVAQNSVKPEPQNQVSNNSPDTQTQHHTDRTESYFNEKDTIKKLEQTFRANRRHQADQIVMGWDNNTRELELAEFEKTMCRTVRAKYRKQGLDSNLVKSALTEYVANKHLPLDENHFATWAKKQGHELNGNETDGYRLNSTKHVGDILKDTLSKIGELRV